MPQHVLSAAPPVANVPVAPAPAPGAAQRFACALGCLFWLAAFAWLWLGLTPQYYIPEAGRAAWLAWGRGLGLAWFALGALWPAGFVFSLALAFPWFGNNPGGPHHLYLLEMGLMGLAAGHLALRALGRVAPRRSRLDLWVFLFAGYSFLSAAVSFQWYKAEFQFNPRGFLSVILNHYGDANTFGLQAALKLALGVSLYVVLRDRPWSLQRQARLWWVMLGALALTALAGWLDYLKLLPIHWLRQESQFVEARFGWARLQSLYGHAGWLAQYIEALGPGALALGLAARRPRARWGWLALTALLAVTQFFTMARAGWIGLAGGLGVVLVASALADASPHRLRRLALRLALLGGALALMAGALALLNHDFRNRLGELFAVQHRTSIWKFAFQMCRIHPFLGVGMGNYLTVVKMFHPQASVDFVFAADNITAHNLYLHALAERGVTGLILLLCLLGAVWLRLLAGLRRAEPGDEGRRALLLAVLGGVTALALDGLFQYIFYVRVIEILFWLLLGFSAALAAPGTRPPHGRRGRTLAALFLAVELVVFAGAFREVVFEPMKPWLGPQQFQVGGGQEVRAPLPAGARRVRLSLASLAPDTEKSPPCYTLLLGGQVLAQVQLQRSGEVRQVELELPAGRPAAEPLLIRSSRRWSLWMYGGAFRQWPYAWMGVLYTLPEKIN